MWGYIKHSSCKELCPENCSYEWKTFDDFEDPWEVDETLMVNCGKNLE